MLDLPIGPVVVGSTLIDALVAIVPVGKGPATLVDKTRNSWTPTIGRLERGRPQVHKFNQVHQAPKFPGVESGWPLAKIPEEFHMQNGTCRNNFIVSGPDAGIELWWVNGVKIYNNTVWRRENRGRGIRCGARNRGVHIANNLVRGQILLEGDSAERDARLENNITGSLDGYFVNPGAGDLHLTAQAAAALNAAVPFPEITDDFDSVFRDSLPDIGASEFGARRQP